MVYGYEIKFWHRALTDEEIIHEYLISDVDGPLEFPQPEPEPEPRGIILISGSGGGGNVFLEEELHPT